jgi:hypothetical protein
MTMTGLSIGALSVNQSLGGRQIDIFQLHLGGVRLKMFARLRQGYGVAGLYF